MELPKNLKDEIWEYCRLNDITDLNAFMIRMLKQGYNIEKYGATPFKIGGKETEVIEKIVEVPFEVIKEVIVEKEVIKEIPVEVEKIIEVIKEVPVEIIKEVIVEKTSGNVEKLVEKEVIVEKLVEIPVEIIKEVIVEKEIIIDNKDEVKKLQQQIENLKIEIELEKNRNYVPPKKENTIDEPTKKGGLSNIINWVSRTERDNKDIYGE